MSPEALALKVIAELAIEYGDDVIIAIISAVRAAFDQGATEAEALASARLHMPDRIDTTDEDAARRKRMLAAVNAAPPIVEADEQRVDRIVNAQVKAQRERCLIRGTLDPSTPSPRDTPTGFDSRGAIGPFDGSDGEDDGA